LATSPINSSLTDDPLATAPPSELLRKLSGVAEWSGRLRYNEVREAHRRSQLITALMDSLAERAATRQALAGERFARYRAVAARNPAIGRGTRGLDRLLARLGSLGQALVIARSGLWRQTGSFLHDLRHMAAYARRGPDPSVVPAALVDQAWYLATFPDVAASGLAPLVHYLVAGRYEGRSPHPLFDADFYRRHNADALAATGLDPLSHFVAVGAAEGRDPHPLFSLAYYVGQAPDLAESGMNPLVHYLETGWAPDLSPHPLFDPAWYRASLPVAAAAQPPLVHYLTAGAGEGRKPHSLVDPAWYRAQYDDVAAAGFEPLTHFVESGAAEGRSPSAWFDLPHYVAARGEALPAGINPLADYLLGGAWHVGEARPGLPTGPYMATRPELVRQGRTPLDHWARLEGPDAASDPEPA
jgi:hypothetical protein